MTETASTPPTSATNHDDYATGGGDPFFETDPADAPDYVVTPAELQRCALDALSSVLSQLLPRCSWTMHAPHPDHVFLYTSGQRPILSGIPTTAADVRTWATHFGVNTHAQSGSAGSLVRTQFPLGGVTVEVFANKYRTGGEVGGHG